MRSGLDQATEACSKLITTALPLTATNFEDLRASRAWTNRKLTTSSGHPSSNVAVFLGVSSRHAILAYIRVGFVVSTAFSLSRGLRKWQQRRGLIVAVIPVNCHLAGCGYGNGDQYSSWNQLSDNVHRNLS